MQHVFLTWLLDWGIKQRRYWNMGKFEYGMEIRCYSISVKSLGCDVILVINKKILILRKRRAVVSG